MLPIFEDYEICKCGRRPSGPSSPCTAIDGAVAVSDDRPTIPRTSDFLAMPRCEVEAGETHENGKQFGRTPFKAMK
ncbi:hypothetical protein CCHR01_10209 [Colletotrichum chrysophilum]|uniref:Uncharacterized protein n=1 Tax=Colletotrichum chrysophilum TaxID=1836956 RepID=A0AAD9AGB4_9PEZI|nr:hypothetical protein CCHR01_10209 [Colletotrichum chrysophilum]